jgi:hypothetical protein
VVGSRSVWSHPTPIQGLSFWYILFSPRVSFSLEDLRMDQCLLCTCATALPLVVSLILVGQRKRHLLLMVKLEEGWISTVLLTTVMPQAVLCLFNCVYAFCTWIQGRWKDCAQA